MSYERAPAQRSAAGSRLHIVLIPGFAGFDALGQLEYYAGVTPIFGRWQSGEGRRRPIVLHYFDNFPTAAVATRAGRLRRFLCKRIARGEFQPGDSVALVGHSTGGLDIRRLLCDLSVDPDATLTLDGTAEVPSQDLLDLINRVVFLSVPQLGTNIAHWVRDNVLARSAVVAQLRTSVAASQVPLVNRIQDTISAAAAKFLDLDLLRAIEDSVREAEVRTGGDPSSIANAHEAAAQLELWLRHMAWDFAAIDDLIPATSKFSAMSEGRSAGRLSPAQFTRAMRQDEIANWREHHIATRSYATRSTRPFRFEPLKEAPPLDLLNPCTWPDLTPKSADGAGTDWTYRYAYRACAGGPFRAQRTKRLTTFMGEEARYGCIEVWDNDGIVNTASMLWPSGENTVLVECDHMDIVGHFDLAKATDQNSGRVYRAYDLLGSASGFDKGEFEAVWHEIFGFCETEDEELEEWNLRRENVVHC